MTMELLSRFMFLAAFVLMYSCSHSQNIEKASFEENILKVKFTNNGTQEITVPDLSSRISPNNPEFIFDKYYKVHSDTLVLELTRAIHIDIGKTRTPDGLKYIKEVEYVDEKLKPGESFDTKVRFKDLGNIKIKWLRIKYEEDQYCIKLQ